MDLDKSLVRLDVQVHDAEHAITCAGQVLVDAGSVTPAYVDAMVDAYRNLGPYIVLAPHIAMPHARPESGAVTEAIAVVRLLEPVAFGHPENDPVKVVIPLAGADSNSHVDLLRRIARTLTDPQSMTTILESDDAQEIAELFNQGGLNG